jgi:putative ABC transport system ATP-binding protein
MLALEIQKVVKSFEKGHFLFNQLSFQLMSGQSLALLGRSGSGKSTLLQLVAGIEKPDAGNVLVFNTDIVRLNKKEVSLFRRKKIGFIYQSFQLFPGLTVKENIALPLELLGYRKKDWQPLVMNWLKRLYISSLADRFPQSLSGGEQQRVAIARALIHQPDLILADEPTGNLDAENGREVLKILKEQVIDAGKTLLLVTHSQEAAAIAQQQVLLHQGVLLPATAHLTW